MSKKQQPDLKKRGAKAFIFVILTLPNSFKVSETNSFAVVQEKKMTAPLFRKAELWMGMR